MKLRNAAIKLLWATLIFLWFGGVIAHVFLGGPPAHVAWTAPLFLVVAGIMVFISAERKMLPRLAVAGAIGMSAEIVGVHTGVPFGNYEYTTALYPRLSSWRHSSNKSSRHLVYRVLLELQHSQRSLPLSIW
jgi:uncharacterized membrane protein